jgi:hypothetical protein
MTKIPKLGYRAGDDWELLSEVVGSQVRASPPFPPIHARSSRLASAVISLDRWLALRLVGGCRRRSNSFDTYDVSVETARTASGP